MNLRLREGERDYKKEKRLVLICEAGAPGGNFNSCQMFRENAKGKLATFAHAFTALQLRVSVQSLSLASKEMLEGRSPPPPDGLGKGNEGMPNKGQSGCAAAVSTTCLGGLSGRRPRQEQGEERSWGALRGEAAPSQDGQG